MENPPVDWTPALAALAVGLVIGVVLVLRSRAGRKAAAAVVPRSGSASAERRDLESRRDVLIGQLRELEDTAAKRSPEQLARERLELELEAARVLLALDELAGRPAPAAAPAAPAAPVPASGEAAPPVADDEEPDEGGNPALRGFLWAAGSMAVVGLVVYLVTGAAQVREEGGSVTGNTPGMGQRPPAGQAATSAPATPEEAQIQAAVQQNPDDLEARLALARVYLGKQDMMGVWNETQYVLAKRPDDPYALSYQSLVRLAMGQPQVALEMLERSLAKEPEVLQTYVHKALVQLRIGDAKGADATFKTAAGRFPEQVQMLSQLQERMKREVEPIAVEGDPHAGVGAPGGAAGAPAPTPPSTTAAAASGPLPQGAAASVVLELDPAAAAALTPDSVIFVVIREAGARGGPPTAVKRLPPGPFPLRFTIGSGDSMTGDALPASLQIEARVDADGNAASRDPGDPLARADGVKSGTTDVKLVLRRP